MRCLTRSTLPFYLLNTAFGLYQEHVNSDYSDYRRLYSAPIIDKIRLVLHIRRFAVPCTFRENPMAKSENGALGTGVARTLRMREVEGSNPSVSILFCSTTEHTFL